MRINGVDYGPIWAASGAMGFFGEGYLYHKLYSFLSGFSLEGMTFVAKTVTNAPTKGNMPLWKNWKPKAILPRCIWFDAKNGIALNAVGLSNHGFDAALKKGIWQQRDVPFMLSWMPLTEHTEFETQNLVYKLEPVLESFKTKPALQVNLSCPNTGEDLSEIIKDAAEILQILEPLNIPLIPKFNVLTSPEAVAAIAEKVRVDGIVMSNTIPFGELGNRIAWEKKTGVPSPLIKRGLKQPGGLSGTDLFPIVRDWILEAEAPLQGLPINFCGGIDSAERVEEAFSLPNVQSVSVGTAIMLRPRRMEDIIKTAYQMQT